MGALLSSLCCVNRGGSFHEGKAPSSRSTPKFKLPFGVRWLDTALAPLRDGGFVESRTTTSTDDRQQPDPEAAAWREHRPAERK
jgi:hypothetical protein